MFMTQTEPKVIPSNCELIWRIYKRSNSDVIGLYTLILILSIIFILPYLIGTDPYSQNPNSRLLPPSWEDAGELQHFFGTDEFGRDFLSRLLIGGQNTIKCAFIATVIAMGIGCILGLFSSITKHRARQSFFHHMFDILLSIPSILIALITVAILGPSLPHAMLAIAISQIPRFIHTTYYAVQHELSKDYITANILDGASYFRLTRMTILPNILGTIVRNFSQGLSVSLLDLSAIGFLGFGAQAPEPEWGNMLASGIDLIYIGSSKAIIPGLSLMLLIIAINLVGHGLERLTEVGVKHAST